ncbi:MAG: T9SS type A sorting domain-containing protein [Flavobacteriales bacterium]|nr:T9SS type A sorting domain-containing protein [Flavobacteriales bacterium]
MKRIVTLSLFVIAFLTFQKETVLAQCPGCIIDTQCGVGISPVAPALCPAVLPNGVQGQPYDENATFFMPRDFTDEDSGQDVTLNSITVTNVTGMPQGLSYTCDQPGCTYTVTNDPLTQRGCVKMCGTPTVPGNYNIVIAVVANVSTPIGVINQPTSFTIPLTIEPSPGGNCCFSYNPPSACGTLDVTYEALLNFGPLQPTTYAWDFGNGNVSTSATPPVESYTTAGDFYPELTTTVNNYVITDVSFTAAGTNWCGDVEEINLFGVCQGNPDIYYTFSNGNQGSTSTSGSNSLTKTWTGLNHVLVDNIFSLQFWDEDGTSADDNLGIYTQNVTAPGTFNMNTFVNGNQEGFGTITIGLQVDTVYITEDTVTVLPIPAMPQLVFSPAQQVCVGDSILISGPVGPYQYQWIQAGSFISDSVAVWVDETDYYSLAIIDTTVFCGIESDSSLVEIFTFPLPPVIGYSTATGELFLNNPNNYVIEWYDGNNLVQGETGNTFDPTGLGGPFTARYLNGGLCSSQSSTAYSLCLPATIQPLANDTICCGETLTFDATGFLVNPFSTIAWAVTPEATGPVTDQASATAAEANGYLLNGFGTTASFSRDCLSHEDSVMQGSYFVTPFAIENPAVEPLTYDTLQGCRPYAQICPALDAVDDNWEIFPMVFTFPDNSTLNVNDAIAFGLPINQQLLDLAGGLPCLALTDLFRGNPNGVWSISITNTGTTALDMSVPDFIVINSADSCSLITQDETYLIEGVELTANPGQTVVVSFDIPPLPTSFPSVSPDCEAFGEPLKIYFKDCYPHTSHLGIDEMDTYGFLLGDCVPNPTTGTSVINFSSKVGGDYQFVIRDVTGKEVSKTTLYAAAGDNRFNFDGSSLSSGLYTYSLSNGVNVLTQRLVISK